MIRVIASWIVIMVVSTTLLFSMLDRFVLGSEIEESDPCEVNSIYEFELPPECEEVSS